MCLAKIAEAMKYAHSNNYYITADASFKNIDAWTTSVSSLLSSSPPTGTDLRNPPTKSSNLSATDIPDFDLPSFTGQAVDGIDWMADVKDVFNNKGLIKYLDDENHCAANLEFSTAFASRLRTSVRHGTVLGHIYALEEKNNNCANLWSVIVGKLCKKGILISQECRYWKQFSHLRCDSVEQFPKFHSDMTTVMHRLQQMAGTAISDKNFLRVQFAQKIAIPEIKNSSQKFLTDFMTDPLDIFQKCEAAYQALETTNAMHNADDPIPRKKPVIRKNATDTEKKKPAAQRSAVLLPKNVDGLVPSHIYGMMKKWFNLAIKGDKITSAEKDSIKAIKWPESKKEERKQDWGSGYPPHSAGSRDSWNACHVDV